MDAAITEDLKDTEHDLRFEFGTETFKIGKNTIECRTAGGDISNGFGDDGPRKKVERISIVAFKDEWPGRPYSGQEVTWINEDAETKMRVERCRGSQKVSPTWHMDLVSL